MDWKEIARVKGRRERATMASSSTQRRAKKGRGRRSPLSSSSAAAGKVPVRYWTEHEHDKLVKGIVRHGMDDKTLLAPLVPNRSYSAVGNYIRDNKSKLLRDCKSYTKNQTNNKIKNDDNTNTNEDSNEDEEDSSDVDDEVEDDDVEEDHKAMTSNTSRKTIANKKLWTEQEHMTIVKGMVKYGMDCSLQQIYPLLPNRTDGAIRYYMNRKKSAIFRDCELHKRNNNIVDSSNNDDDDEEEDDEEVKDVDEKEDEKDSSNRRSSSATAAQARKSWTEQEHKGLVKGIVKHGIEDIDALAPLVPNRTRGAIGTYISRHKSKVLRDVANHQGYDDADDKDDVDKDKEDEATMPPPQKKSKHSNDDGSTEPVSGFWGSVANFFSGTWFWPSSMPKDDTTSTSNNDNDVGDQDMEEESRVVDSDSDTKVAAVDNSNNNVNDDDDDLLQNLPGPGKDFLLSIGIKSGKALVESNAKELGEKYVTYRQDKDLFPYKGSGALQSIYKWQRIIAEHSSDTTTRGSSPSKKRGRPTLTPQKSKRMPSTVRDDENNDDDDDTDQEHKQSSVKKPTPKSKWTAEERQQLVVGITLYCDCDDYHVNIDGRRRLHVTFGKDHKSQLTDYVRSRSYRSVETYISRHYDQLMEDTMSYINSQDDR